MLSLAIDTSSAIAVAVMCDGDILAQESVYEPRGHAERLSGVVRDVMAAASVAGRDVDRVVAGTGPAPFTGLRVGLVTAWTMAHAWDVPALGVCSLDALGMQHGGDVTVVADARRREVYVANYVAGARVSGPGVYAPADVNVEGAVVGRGARLYAEYFPDAAEPFDPDPVWLVRAVDTAIAAGETRFPVKPLYLRRPDVHGTPQA